MSEPSSQNSSFSCTPNSKPHLHHEVELRSAANRSLSVGPKNLLEVSTGKGQVEVDWNVVWCSG